MDFSKVKKFIDSLESQGIPGADVAIYLKGEEVYRYQIGVADMETGAPITSDSLFPIYSMTKVITCVAALRLFEEGRYLMTDPLYEYMPEFKNMTIRYTRANGERMEKPAKRPIRIVDLFTMTSGYSYEASGAGEFLVKTKGNFLLKDLASTLATKPLAFEPGTRWCYGFSHDILGALIEVLSGKKLGEYFNDNIFNPLGMDDTGFKIPTEKHSRLVSCYTFDENNKTHTKSVGALSVGALGYLNFTSPLYLSDDWILEMAGAGLVSSVDDYAKFANTLCMGGTSENNYRLLGEATINLMSTNHLDEVMMSDFSHNWVHNRGYGYGLGVRTMVRREACGSNSSFGEFGWAGLAGTYFAIDPVLELVYVYAQQLSPSKEEIIAPRLKNVIYGCL